MTGLYQKPPETTLTSSNRKRTLRRLRALFAVALIWALPTLACGSFAPRPTPTPTVPPPTPTLPGASADNTQPTAAAPTPEPPSINPVGTGVATPAPPITATVPVTATATPSATGGPVGGLAPGQPARVTAPAGLNLRDQASTAGNLLVQLDTGGIVTVLEGPVQADNFTWWRVQDSTGRTGWVAQGDAETVWLTPEGAGGASAPPQPQNRPPRVGERVQVTMGDGGQLSVRAQPGTAAALVARVNTGTQYTILAGPQSADGDNWFQIRSDDGSVQGWAAEGEGTDRWLSPLE
jgi:hypothetical protein